MLLFILVLVGGVIGALMCRRHIRLFTIEMSILEVIWTLVPAVILIFLGVPSLVILYQNEKNFFTNITLKVAAHQWY